MGGTILMGATAAQALEPSANAPSVAPLVQKVQFDGAPDAGAPGAGSGPRQAMVDPNRPYDPVGPHHMVDYHGFQIDIGGVEGVMNPTNAIGSVEHQIDIVDSAGLSPSMLRLFRSVPIRVSARFAEGSHYSGGSDVVLGGGFNDDRPVLLHEYMHVLNYKTMPQGFHNPTIVGFYKEALEKGLYRPGAYMLLNPSEFFAITASCYLHGTVAREPFTKEAILEKQPDYYAYLARMFGPGGGPSASAAH